MYGGVLMQSVFNNMGIIIGFLIIMFLIEFFGGDKLGSNMALLILFSMIILNANTFTTTMSGIFKKEEK